MLRLERSYDTAYQWDKRERRVTDHLVENGVSRACNTRWITRGQCQGAISRARSRARVRRGSRDAAGRDLRFRRSDRSREAHAMRVVVPEGGNLQLLAFYVALGAGISRAKGWTWFP